MDLSLGLNPYKFAFLFMMERLQLFKQKDTKRMLIVQILVRTN